MKTNYSFPLIDTLSELRAEMLREENALASQIQKICEVHREGARNLVHYIALRRHDIRELQEHLTAHGLASLGRIEYDVLGSVERVLWLFHRIAGDRHSEPMPSASSNDWDLLERNTDALLGPRLSERNARIMVTMPSEAAGDFGLVRDLLLSGMNCMRINCAHDGPEQWAAMIANLKKAMVETGRDCRVHMDLGGPKLRTGPMESGPAVLKFRPRRDAYGRVISPARLFLTPARDSQTPSAPADAVVPVPASWLAKLDRGDRITFKDARGASRSMRITEVDAKNRWAESDYTAYITSGTVLEAVFGKASRHSGTKAQAKVGTIPNRPQAINLRRGGHIAGHAIHRAWQTGRLRPEGTSSAASQMQFERWMTF